MPPDGRTLCNNYITQHNSAYVSEHLRQGAPISLQNLKLGEEQKKLKLQVSSFKSTLLGISMR